jgi:hypothetical protein
MPDAATATATPEAPQQAAAPPAPPAPFGERELAGLLDYFPQVEPDRHGPKLWFRVPAAERPWLQRVRREGAALLRPVEEARAAALAGEEAVEFRRRSEALRSSQLQARYYEVVRAPELKLARQQALARGDDSALAQAELDLALADAELKKFTERTAALGPLVEQARKLAAEALRVAVRDAHRAAFDAAARQLAARRRELAEAVYRLLVPVLEAEHHLEEVRGPAAAAALAELPPEGKA